MCRNSTINIKKSVDSYIVCTCRESLYLTMSFIFGRYTRVCLVVCMYACMYACLYLLYVCVVAAMPFGQLPVLEIDGEMLAQTRSIFRYLAKQAGRWSCVTHDVFTILHTKRSIHTHTHTPHTHTYMHTPGANPEGVV